jgi:tetratricopeptide (TPR) repeat protein
MPPNPLARQHLRRGVELHKKAAATRQGAVLNDAVNAYRASVAADPLYALAWSNLAVALTDQGRFADALDAARRAAALEAETSYHWTQLANLLALNNLPADALDAARHAVALDGNSEPAHFFAAMSLLTLGRMEEGWAEFEWRLSKAPPPAGGRKIWDGSPLGGRPIILRAEGGFGLGDVIHFVRYAALLKRERGAGRVVVECHPQLNQLMRAVDGVDDACAPGGGDDAAATAAGIELEVPILSLPHRFGTTLATVPANVPYITVDPQAAAAWRARLGDEFTIGLAWAGSPKSYNFAQKSCPTEYLATLLSIPGTRFVSLHLDLPAPAGVATFPTELMNWTGTAALISCLDLVITVDTAAAHLAGARGRPVWTMLHFAADWRWMPRSGRQPVVPDDAIVPATRARRLGGCGRAHRRGRRAVAGAAVDAQNDNGGGGFTAAAATVLSNPVREAKRFSCEVDRDAAASLPLPTQPQRCRFRRCRFRHGRAR